MENGRGVGAGSRLSATWLGRLGAGRGRGGESGEASGGSGFRRARAGRAAGARGLAGPGARESGRTAAQGRKGGRAELGRAGRKREGRPIKGLRLQTFSNEFGFEFEGIQKVQGQYRNKKYTHKTPSITKALKHIVVRFLFLKVFEFEIICAK